MENVKNSSFWYLHILHTSSVFVLKFSASITLIILNSVAVKFLMLPIGGNEIKILVFYENVNGITLPNRKWSAICYWFTKIYIFFQQSIRNVFFRSRWFVITPLSNLWVLFWQKPYLLNILLNPEKKLLFHFLCKFMFRVFKSNNEIIFVQNYN